MLTKGLTLKNDTTAAKAPQLLPIELVTLAGDQLVTDSRRVAKHFKRTHAYVLRRIRELTVALGEEHRGLFYEVLFPVPGNNGATRNMPGYQLTKDGFVLLAMGFTGDEALRIKLAYIKAFNAMADQLQRRDLGVWQQMQALIAREIESKVRASFGSHLMLARKREIPRFTQERQRLEHQIQPGLLLN